MQKEKQLPNQDIKGPPSLNVHVDERVATVEYNEDNNFLESLELGEYDLGVEWPIPKAMNSNQEESHIRLTTSTVALPTPPKTDSISPTLATRNALYP